MEKLASTSGYEIELKFKLDNVPSLKQKLLQLGLTSDKEVFEQNYVFDTLDKQFFREDKLLRLRKVDNSTVLTFKGAKEKEGNVGKRREIELTVSDFEQMCQVFESLGFILHRIYEKKRTVYEYKNVEIMLDLVPFIGSFLEIEGAASEIESLAKLLGLNITDACNYTYGNIAEEWFKKGYQLTFEEEEKHLKKNIREKGV